MGDIENVATVGGQAHGLGPDQGPVNLAIMNFAKGLEKLRKKAMAESDAAIPPRKSAGAAKLKSLTDLQEKIMINLSKREKLSPPAMIWIVKTASNLGTDEAKAAAADLIEKIFDKANEGPGIRRGNQGRRPRPACTPWGKHPGPTRQIREGQGPDRRS